jgi:UDP-sugar pyrophosphorylase
MLLQDTNALCFKVLPACLGVSKQLGLQVNSVAVARTPGEAIGGLMRLTHADGRAMTANVEYNQIDALLKARRA